MCQSQYWSYYPQVGPRSTFIGFTITDHSSPTAAPEREWKALLWGKHPSYMGLERNEGWLRAISEHIPIVATIDSDALESGEFADTLPEFVENRGLLEPSEYFELLRSSALLIGLSLSLSLARILSLRPSLSHSVCVCACVCVLCRQASASRSGATLRWTRSSRGR